MIKSIQQFEEIGIKKFEKIIEKFMKNPKDMTAFVYGIRDEVIAFGLEIIKETLEDCNQMLRDSEKTIMECGKNGQKTADHKPQYSLSCNNIVPE